MVTGRSRISKKKQKASEIRNEFEVMQTVVEVAVASDGSRAWSLCKVGANFNFGVFVCCPFSLLKSVQTVRLPPKILQGDNTHAVRLERDPELWMTAITPARCIMEQNVEMVRVPDGKIGLRSTREIGASEELRVWFSSAMSEELGLYRVRVDDKQGSYWVCRKCGVKFLFPNLLQAHVALTCNENDVIKETTNEQATESPSMVGGEEMRVSATEEEREGKYINLHEEKDESSSSESSADVRNRKLSENHVGPSAFGYVAHSGSREFRINEAYGLSAALVQHNQRLLEDPKIARLISSFSRPRLLKISSEPESIAEYQKKEFRKKFQGNEHYLHRHLYRDGGNSHGVQLEKFEDVLGRGDEDKTVPQTARTDDQRARGDTSARDSRVKYGPFYSSDDFRLALHREAKALDRASGSGSLLQPLSSIVKGKHGFYGGSFPGKNHVVSEKDGEIPGNDHDTAEREVQFRGSDQVAERGGFRGNDHVVAARRGGFPGKGQVGGEGEVGKAACTCGSHENASFLGSSDEEEGEAQGDVKLDLSRSSNVVVVEEHRNGSVSALSSDETHRATRRVNWQSDFFHGNGYLCLNALYSTTSTQLPYKLPSLGNYRSSIRSQSTTLHPEPALLLDPLYYYSTNPRMLPEILPQSPTQTHARAQGFRCDFCGKAYCRKYVLKIHMRTHTGFKPLQCKVCDKSFSDPSNMKKHVKLHETEDTAYSCPHCGRNFVRYRGLLNHLKSKHAQTLPL